MWRWQLHRFQRRQQRVHLTAAHLLGGRWVRVALGGSSAAAEGGLRASHGLTHLSADGRTPQMVTPPPSALNCLRTLRDGCLHCLRATLLCGFAAHVHCVLGLAADRRRATRGWG
jgi:hypothetical protein